MSVDNRLLKETNPEVGQPVPYVLPQHGIDGTQQFGRTMGRNGHMFVASKDGEFTTIGATTDAESASGNGTFIAILKRVRTLLTAVFEAVVTLGQAIGTAKAILIAGSDGTNLRAIRTKSDGTTLVEVTGSILQDAVTLQNNVSADGNGSTATVAGQSTAVFEVSGTFAATVNFEGSINGTTWHPLMATQMGHGAISSLATVPGLYRSSVAGLAQVRARVAGRTSGSVTVVARSTVTEAPSKAVVVGGNNFADVIFHDAVSATGNGLIYSVGGYKTLTVEIFGTSTSRQVTFRARGPAGADRPLTGLRLADLVADTSTTGTAEIWQFDITGLTSILFPIASVTGGNVSVRGRVVA